MNRPTSAPTDRLTVQFLPLHKRAFGNAIGVAAALALFGVTAATVILQQEHSFGLGLLSQYFSGYSVSWPGAFIGAAWAGFIGFIMGWFLAFSRNFLAAIQLLYLRARADFEQTQNFLDHI